MNLSARCAVFAVFVLTFSVFAAPDPFAENVRPTDRLTPEEELKSFKVPDGFTIQLVAAEPDIHKPINIAVDAKGRLWTSSTIEYPLVAKADAGKARDEIKVIEIDPATGHAKKITTFADGLNIPTGVYPYKNGVVGFSIPNIYYFQDTDGDGKADKREVLYGPFDVTRDTHGMTNSFIRGFDGWMYGTHGFNNHSTIKGSDGSSMYLESGNIYRVALDGSHVDHLTHGPINPFGLMFDTAGQLYVADCHTKPFQVVLRGAWFEHFGRPHDGIGFYPQIMGHLHGSTAIGGVVTIDDDRWPEEFRGNLLCGNPVTCRVNRDSLVYSGSTPAAKEKPDFVESKDPWFRPVAFALSPDGSIYIADFYNKIIGHYEVPLNHPGRDRTSGRIWRVVPPKQAGAREYPTDFSAMNAEQLVDALSFPNISARMLATDELSDRIGKDAIAPCRAILTKGTPTQKVHAMWVLYRLKALEAGEILGAAKDGERLVRVHAQRALTEVPALSADERNAVLVAMKDADPLVRRCAAEALAQHPDLDNVRPLLDLITSTNSADTHLIYAARIALRRQLETKDVLAKLPLPQWSEADDGALNGVLPAIATPEAGAYLLKQFTADKIAPNSPVLGDLLKQLSRFGAEVGSAAAINFTKEKFPKNLEHQLNLLKAIQDGTAQRGGKLDDASRAWAAELVTAVLKQPTRNANQRMQTVGDLAKALSLKECAPAIAGVMNDPKADPNARAAAIKTVLSLDPSSVNSVAELVGDANQSTAIREAAAKALSEANTDAARQAVLMPIRVAPHAIALKLAVALASRPEGANTLMDAFERNTVLPRLLLEPTLKDKLVAAKIKDLDQRITALTKNLAPASAQLDALIAKKRTAYKPGKGDIEKGKIVFAKTCAICHQIEGQGAVVGPQLDGVGARGLDRILEDVIDPNRNVDPMFRFTNITLKDDDTISGLVRAEVGQTVTLVDPTGKENTIPKADIKTREISKLSLMPTGFGEIIPADDFNDLLAFMLSKTAAKKP